MQPSCYITHKYAGTPCLRTTLQSEKSDGRASPPPSSSRVQSCYLKKGHLKHQQSSLRFASTALSARDGQSANLQTAHRRSTTIQPCLLPGPSVLLSSAQLANARGEGDAPRGGRGRTRCSFAGSSSCPRTPPQHPRRLRMCSWTRLRRRRATRRCPRGRGGRTTPAAPGGWPAPSGARRPRRARARAPTAPTARGNRRATPPPRNTSLGASKTLLATGGRRAPPPRDGCEIQVRRLKGENSRASGDVHRERGGARLGSCLERLPHRRARPVDLESAGSPPARVCWRATETTAKRHERRLPGTVSSCLWSDWKYRAGAAHPRPNREKVRSVLLLRRSPVFTWRHLQLAR